MKRWRLFRRARQQPLERRPFDLLSLTILVVLGVHAPHLPVWLSLGLALLLGMRWLQRRRLGGRAPAYLKLPLIALLAAAVISHYGTLFGREPGSALAIGLLVVAPGLPSRRLVIPMALSGLLYGLGYLPASVACELRYHLWTMLAVLIGALIAASDMAGGTMPDRRRLLLAAAPVLLVTILCLAWRLA